MVIPKHPKTCTWLFARLFGGVVIKADATRSRTLLYLPEKQLGVSRDKWYLYREYRYLLK